MDEEKINKDPMIAAVEQLELVWRSKWRIITMTLIPTILAVGVTLLLTKYYVASTSVLPDLDFLGGLKGRLAGLQDLAGDLGLGGGTGMSPSQLYPEIIVSESILRNVIYHKYQTAKYPDPVNLLEYWEYDDPDSNLNFEVALKKVRENVIAVSVDRKTTIITITAEMPEPQLAADVANRITYQLDTYQRKFRNTSAGAQRKFLETRLNDVKYDLHRSEENLKSFREKNRSIAQSPQLVLEQARLERDLTINNSIYIELRKQFEFVKLDEVKNTPVVTILDQARPPAKKDRPRRIMIVLTVFMISLIASISWVIFEKFSNELKESNAGYKALTKFIQRAISEIPLINKLLH